MLAVAEDSTAAQLMGIRPDTMQAIAWAIAAGATGLAGALIATFFYIVPTVGETLAFVASSPCRSAASAACPARSSPDF
jgi:branched-chain amino acid transport system permease protein